MRSFGSPASGERTKSPHRRTENEIRTDQGNHRRATEQLVAALKAGHSETLTGYLKAIGRFHRYSLHNVLLIVRDFVEMKYKKLILPLRKRTTQHGYKIILAHHIFPAFGDKQLVDVTGEDVQEFVTGKLGSGLAWNTVKNIITSLPFSAPSMPRASSSAISR